MRAATEIMAEMMSYSDLLAAAIVRRMSPKDDEISTRQAYADYGQPWITKAVRQGLLHKRRKGNAKNSPVMFSKHEILALIETERTMVRRAQEFIANK